MPIKSFSRIAEELRATEEICAGNHTLEDKPSSFGTAGRFGGHTFPLFKCLKCGQLIPDQEKMSEAYSHYDEGGRPLKSLEDRVYHSKRVGF